MPDLAARIRAKFSKRRQSDISSLSSLSSPASREGSDAGEKPSKGGSFGRRSSRALDNVRPSFSRATTATTATTGSHGTLGRPAATESPATLREIDSGAETINEKPGELRRGSSEIDPTATAQPTEGPSPKTTGQNVTNVAEQGDGGCDASPDRHHGAAVGSAARSIPAATGCDEDSAPSPSNRPELRLQLPTTAGTAAPAPEVVAPSPVSPTARHSVHPLLSSALAHAHAQAHGQQPQLHSIDENAAPKPNRSADGSLAASRLDPLIAEIPPTPSSDAPVDQTPPSAVSSQFPSSPLRRQSLFSNRQTALIKSLLHSPTHPATHEAGAAAPLAAHMVTRKIWVRRPGASATLVTINEDDLVDDVRELILRKYANSLGKSFDSPDLTLRIHPRDQQKDRALGPEEPMCRTLDACFPNGQTVEEALSIDIPRRTPKASPRAPLPPHTTYYIADDGRPSEGGEGYFPPVAGGVSSPHLPLAIPAPINGTAPHSIAVLGTGHIPPIPSPGATRPRPSRERSDRPRLGRTHTASPTVIANGNGPTPANHGMQHYVPRLTHSRTHSSSSEHAGAPPATALPAVSNSPVPETRAATPPPARMSSPRPPISRPKRSKKNLDQLTPPPGMLNGTVPPISVLIVEDNPINLKLLEAFVKRLKVRWQTAMNGADAVKRWRTGGFHLVLMDIQLPVMNGLEATREIRRLERVNSIGVFSSSPGSMPDEKADDELKEQDRLANPSLFKSPVIIVALTASSLQSDRHEALAAGCNDFLTKPVNFVWLERKVMEWGCMQALIDFDGWRKWKDFSQEAAKTEVKTPAKAKTKKNRSSLSSSTQ